VQRSHFEDIGTVVVVHELSVVNLDLRDGNVIADHDEPR
jgi:hypothetical protein